MTPARTVRERPSSKARPAPVEVPRLLIDTNVVLDLLLDRAPWSDETARLFDAVSRSACVGYVAPHTIATAYYVIERARERRLAIARMHDLLALVQVVPLTTADCQRALTLAMKDYEDALQVVAALAVHAHCLVTRDRRDFKGCDVPTLSAGEVLATLIG